MAKQQKKNDPRPARAGASPLPPVSGNSIVNVPSWLSFLMVALGVVLYSNTLWHDFTLDDFGAIKENWIVKAGFKHWDLLWSTEYRYGSWASPGSLYRPLTLAMFSIEWQ
jgi:hypothetical protein